MKTNVKNCEWKQNLIKFDIKLTRQEKAKLNKFMSSNPNYYKVKKMLGESKISILKYLLGSFYPVINYDELMFKQILTDYLNNTPWVIFRLLKL